MLAPRKKLWSTPDTAIDEAIDSIRPLTAADRVVDIGCGDGKVLLRWASRLSNEVQDAVKEFPTFLGIDIDQERIQQARQSLAAGIEQGSIHQSIAVSFVCANALEQESLLKDATVFFLYLIPRGLRIIHPMLRNVVNTRSANKDGSGQPLRVISYMSPLVHEKPYQVIKVAVDHQPGAHWPLYLYRIEPDRTA